jgi:hypothetical protein
LGAVALTGIIVMPDSAPPRSPSTSARARGTVEVLFSPSKAEPFTLQIPICFWRPLTPRKNVYRIHLELYSRSDQGMKSTSRVWRRSVCECERDFS